MSVLYADDRNRVGICYYHTGQYETDYSWNGDSLHSYSGGVVAEESTDATIASTNESEEQWTMDLMHSVALVKVYGADLGMIEDGYGYLLLKWDNEKENFIEVAEDPNGTIDALPDSS